MFNIYGVTYDHTTNYGSCLQAYALQTAIEKIRLGEKAEVCRYMLIPLSKLKEYPKWKYTSVFGAANYALNKLHRLPFVTFEHSHMKFAPITSFSQLDALNDTADAFVCGSDVIWRPEYNRNLAAYYLDFAKKYKFSYAASFGRTDIEESLYEVIGQRLSSFDAISVREPFCAEIVRRCKSVPQTAA